MRLPTTHRARPGLSLLEVLVAMAIFLLALGGISSLVSFAGERAMDVQMRNQAARLCQSKLAEMKAGFIPLTAASDTPFDEDPDYKWSVTADQGAVPSLWIVTIKVTRERPGGEPIESTLSQMVLDPSVIGSTQDVAPVAGGTATTPGGM